MRAVWRQPESDGGGGVIETTICLIFSGAIACLILAALCFGAATLADEAPRLAAYHWTPLPVPVARPGEVVPAEPGGKEVAA